MGRKTGFKIKIPSARERAKQEKRAQVVRKKGEALLKQFFKRLPPAQRIAVEFLFQQEKFLRGSTVECLGKASCCRLKGPQGIITLGIDPGLSTAQRKKLHL
ncbi:MAG: hypothetical protein AAB545_00430 [Patescibacteria group bacterium]